jgi:hypothetical protein
VNQHEVSGRAEGSGKPQLESSTVGKISSPPGEVNFSVACNGSAILALLMIQRQRTAVQTCSPRRLHTVQEYCAILYS